MCDKVGKLLRLRKALTEKNVGQKRIGFYYIARKLCLANDSNVHSEFNLYNF